MLDWLAAPNMERTVLIQPISAQLTGVWGAAATPQRCIISEPARAKDKGVLTGSHAQEQVKNVTAKANWKPPRWTNRSTCDLFLWALRAADISQWAAKS